MAKAKADKAAGKPGGKSRFGEEHIRSALDGTTVAIMMVDRDLIVTYANRATFDIMRKYEAEFRAAFPSFRLDALIGSCIDNFHKHPEYQRRILADPARMPHVADIHVGRLTFQLNVTAVMDHSGKHVGNALEWQDVTQIRAREGEVARLQSAVSSVTTPIMMIDRDFVINYANEATRKLLMRREQEIRKAFPRFDASQIVGTCIDSFHKRPEYQRKLLSDPANLPHQADIHVGDLVFAITVTAITDSAGKYIGNTLEWQDVTEQRDAQ
ncbi:MAG: PAS domain-containing protein, partial [Polyangiales bacterium]